VVDDAEQRQGHRKENALLHADENDNRRSCDRQREFTGALAADGAESTQIDETHRDSEHDRAKNTIRKKLKRTRKEDENQNNDASGDEVRQLICAARTFDHSGLCWAPIHHKRAAESRGGIGGRETDKVGVFVELLMMASGICARRRGTLRNDHYQTRTSNGKKDFHVSPTQIRQPQLGQASGHGSENGDTSLCPVKDGARRDRPGNRKESTGQLGGNAMAEQDSGYNCE
jgi:hypothetical protein